MCSSENVMSGGDAKRERLRLVATVVVGTNRLACPAHRVELTLRILVIRFNLCSGEAHGVAEMRSSQRLRSAVKQLTLEPAWPVAAFHETLINCLRLVTG